MSKITRTAELTANTLIIIVAILLVFILFQKYFFNTLTTSNESAKLQPVIGSKINLPNITWTSQTKTLILVLDARCRFCKESAPFYKRIVENNKNNNVKIIAVFPTNEEEGKVFLKQLGLDNIDVKQSSLNKIKVGGTPTLILINDKGEIINFWVGKLHLVKELELLNQLQ